MPTSAPTKPDNPTRAPEHRPLLTLRPNGRASFNREASRVLPAQVTRVSFVQPMAPGARWLLVPGAIGGHAVSRRRDRLGQLELTAVAFAMQAFAVLPPCSTHLVLELAPWGEGYFQLLPITVAAPALADSGP